MIIFFTVIPNIRYGDKRTYRICCDGISKGGVIAVGSHGTLKNKEDRRIFAEGLSVVVNRIQPKVIVVYGFVPDDIFAQYKDQGIEIIHFDSEFNRAMKSLKGVL